MNRRDLIRGAGGLALFAGLTSVPVWGAALPPDLFRLGVASGDPAPDGFVLWTRLAPAPAEPGGGMPMRAVPVTWQVAEDEGFTRIVQSGEATARPELGHSVHVEVAGLRPARRYWYRFLAGGQASRTGTVKSAPTPGAAVDRLRIGVAGCQHYEGGLFTAYRHLAAEDDLDALFHYGDYIYEHWPERGCPKDEARQPVCIRRHDSDEIYSLDDYRRRYAFYKSDPDLQAAHAAVPFLATWDDHEVDNNWAAEWDESGTPPEAFLLRRAAAMQAWYENMPVRREQFPGLGRLTMFRRLDYGGLLRIHLLDTRQYRTDQRCGGNEQDHCRSTADPSPSQMIGAAQEAWLAEGLNGDARWNLIAQQVMVMPFTYPESRAAGVVNMDSWSGYPDARRRLVHMIEERRLGNVVIASGDVHKHHGGVLPSREGDLESAPVATEYVCTSISSGGDGADFPVGWEGVPDRNPHAHFVSDRRGYQVFEIGADAWRTEVVTVDQVSRPGGVRRTMGTYVTVPGRPGLEPA